MAKKNKNKNTIELNGADYGDIIFQDDEMVLNGGIDNSYTGSLNDVGDSVVQYEDNYDYNPQTTSNTNKKNKKNASSKKKTKTNSNKGKGSKPKTNSKSKPKSNYIKPEDEDADLTTIQKCEKYDPRCTPKRFWTITILATIGMIGVGIGYQLSVPFLLLVALGGFVAARKSILYVCRNKYENQKIENIASYIEQMLYSFRRNYKILSSLEDTIEIFEEGDMRDTIQEAIDYITSSTTQGNIYEEALSIIERKYNCRRVRSLHRFLVKVEGVGGDNELGIQALLNDRRMWLERVDEYKKEKSSVLKEIIIACAFSSIICAVTMYMLPSDVGSMKSIVCRIASTIYILVNQLTVTQTFKKTIFYLNDTYSPDEEEALLNKFRRFKTWDTKAERKKGIKPAIMMIAVAVVGIILGYWWMIFLCLPLAAFSVFVQPLLKYNSTKKTITREIEKAFPDWLLELSLLLQTENLHVALEKTLDTAPLLLSDDLVELGDNIVNYPTEVYPYTQFLRGINVPNIHSSMKLLYSIATYGSEEEERQIAELLERNASLMNKAEEVKNNDRLSKVYIFKFVPMGASALKLIVDMFVFIIMFISQSLTAL